MQLRGCRDGYSKDATLDRPDPPWREVTHVLLRFRRGEKSEWCLTGEWYQWSLCDAGGEIGSVHNKIHLQGLR